jgi:tRNA splicing ligase
MALVTNDTVGGKPPTNDAQAAIESHYSKLENTKIQLRAQSICFDDKAVAICLQPDFPCNNTAPHITVAHHPSVKPVYSNEMLSKKNAQSVPCELVLTAVVIRFVGGE